MIEGGIVFKAHRLSYHSTLGLRVIKKKKRDRNLKDDRAVRAALRGRHDGRDGHVELPETASWGVDLRTTASQKYAAVPRRARM